MTTDKDELLFADETPEEEISFLEEPLAPAAAPRAKPWKVIIADDEEEVHKVTRMVLGDFTFGGQKLHFLHAHSEEETRRMVQEHPDAALLLLDVVMDRDDSGLRIVRYIREELHNHFIRIVLRTGQPGQAPEERVIIDYDINDYKEKNELTFQKLYTVVISSLRAYRDIMALEAHRNGLNRIIEASANIFELQTMRAFATEILSQIAAIVTIGGKGGIDGLDASLASGCTATRRGEGFVVLAGSGTYATAVGKELSEVTSPAIMAEIEKVLRYRETRYFSDRYVIQRLRHQNTDYLILFEIPENLTDLTRSLLDIFFSNMAIAFANINLRMEIEDTQREIIFMLGEVAEKHSRETGFHVKRVAEYSRLLGLRYGMSEDEADLLHMASPMHDVGKLGIPDAVLKKPGALTKEEFELMKTHTQIGYEMLKVSERKVLQAAAIIALQHQEKYDGTGYPHGLVGDAIHIYARIVALADVFDALASDRVYRKAWPMDKILDLFHRERGKHFDPKLVDIFFANLDEILAIRERLREIC